MTRTCHPGLRTVLATLLLGLLCLASLAAEAAKSPWGAGYFPNVALVTQDGATVRFYDDLLRGKVVAINFIYTSCTDVCPLETARLAQVYKLLGDRMGREIFFYSVTVDPKRDTPAVLKQYAERFGAGPGWLFLTGKPEDLVEVRKRMGMAPRRSDDPLRDHKTSLVIGNEAKGEWLRHSALDNPQYLAAVIGDWMTGWKDRKGGKSYAEMPTFVAPTKGEYLFRTRCAACHTIGKGDGLGPDLRGVTAQRERAWLARFIATPDKLREEQDPIATALVTRYKTVRMPNLRLGPEDVEVLLNYLEQEGTAQAHHGPGAHVH